MTLVLTSPMELQESSMPTHADWSLWQQETTLGCQTLGIWTHKLPEATAQYTPFELQLLTAVGLWWRQNILPSKDLM